MAQSQMNEMLEAKVLRKFGKYTIELTKDNELVVTDGWRSDWIIIYDNRTWAHDGVFHLRKDVKAWLNTYCGNTPAITLKDPTPVQTHVWPGEQQQWQEGQLGWKDGI
jgi:hypothetical protein